MEKSKILEINIDVVSYSLVVEKTRAWVLSSESRSVYAANVHMLLEAHDSPEFRNVVNTADLVTPDGMPLVWIMRHKGYPAQERVYGPTLMLELLSAASREKIPVGFLGSTQDVLQKLTQDMTGKFPGLLVNTQIAPPFRQLTSAEDEQLIHEINESGSRILFVGLGCPKQELWIAEHRGKIQAVMVGVGAAFAFHSGAIHQSPAWVQNLGFEWLFRLSQEPQRLWRRYIIGNPRFLFLLLSECWSGWKSKNRGVHA